MRDVRDSAVRTKQREPGSCGDPKTTFRQPRNISNGQKQGSEKFPARLPGEQKPNVEICIEFFIPFFEFEVRVQHKRDDVSWEKKIPLEQNNDEKFWAGFWNS